MNEAEVEYVKDISQLNEAELIKEIEYQRQLLPGFSTINELVENGKRLMLVEDVMLIKRLKK